jgi:phospholipid/cholesterol/gamma-HCH transport system substrate-binding protein
MRSLSLEIKVGLLILAAVGLLVGLLFLLGGIDLGSGYTVYVDFNNPGNVKPGAPVTIGSVPVGSVEEIEYRGGRLDPRTGRRSLIRLPSSTSRRRASSASRWSPSTPAPGRPRSWKKARW